MIRPSRTFGTHAEQRNFNVGAAHPPGISAFPHHLPAKNQKSRRPNTDDGFFIKNGRQIETTAQPEKKPPQAAIFRKPLLLRQPVISHFFSIV